MVTLGEQVQLSRHLASTFTAQRAGILNAWLRGLRDIPRHFDGRLPEAHLEEFAPPTLDALIAYLARGDRKALRRLAVSWARRQDGLGVGLGESLRAILALGPAAAPILRRAGLERGQAQVEGFLAALAEEVARAYTGALKHHFAEKARATQAAEERLLSLQTVAGAVAQERDQERTLELIAREVLKLTGAAEAAVYLPDADDRVLHPVVSIGPDGFNHDGKPEPVETGLLGHVYRSGHLLVASGPEGGDPRPDAAPPGGAVARSTLIAPLRTGGGVIGVLGVRQPLGESFTRADVELLGLFADQAAIALENARLFRETERRGDELETLYRIGTIANRSLDLDRVLNDVLDYILEARDLHRGAIYLLDPACTRLELRTRRDLSSAEQQPALGGAEGATGDERDLLLPASIPYGEGPVGRVAATGELRIDDDAAGQRRAYRIPLRVKGRVLGVLLLFGAPEARPEDDPAELALMTAIGDQIGVALDNANLLAGREARLNQLATLNDILRAISAILDLDSLYDAIHAGCSRLFDTTNFYIAVHHPRTGERTTHRWYEDGRRREDHEGTPIFRGLCPLVMDERRPIRTDDYWAECARRGLEGSPRLNSAGALAWLGVPMIAGDRAIGAIVIASDRQCYTDEDVTLLGTIASGCAVALENARAYAGEQRRADQLRALNEMSRSIVSIRKADYLLPRITDTVRAIFDYNHVGILLHQPGRDELVLKAQATRDARPDDLGLRVPCGAHIVGQVAATRQPLLVNDVAADPRFLATASVEGTRAELALPIVLGDRLLGVLDVGSRHPGAFDAGDVATLQTLADGVAVAMDNARLFEEEHRRRQELTSILDVTKAATSSLLLDEVLRLVARGIAGAVDIPSCTIYLLDETGQWLIPATGVNVSGANGASGHDADPAANFYHLPINLAYDPFLRDVVEGRRAALCADVAADPRTTAEVYRALGLKSILAVPLIAKDRPLGVALVAAVRERYDFSPAQVRLVEGIADTAALALENAQLYARSRELATAEERNRLAREIHDTLAQGLTAVTLHLEVADALLEAPEPRPEARENVRTAMDLTRANLEEARRSVMDLRAAPLQDLSLPEALDQLLRRTGREHGFEGCYRDRGVAGRLPARLESGFYRIAQELLSNIAKHAHATQVDMTLERANGSLVLMLADDGVGFDPAAPRAPGIGGGFGLIGLRERIALLGGSLEFDTAPDEGTRVRVTVPVATSDERRAANGDAK